VKSLVTFPKPTSVPDLSLRAVMITFAQNRDPSLRTRQPSLDVSYMKLREAPE
jgi:hypothetical protein